MPRPFTGDPIRDDTRRRLAGVFELILIALRYRGADRSGLRCRVDRVSLSFATRGCREGVGDATRTVADLNPKTLENAKRQFVELYGSALVMNTYLKIALVLVSLVALGLLALNFHTAAICAGEAAGHPHRRRGTGRGRAVRRDGLPAPSRRSSAIS